MHLLPLTRLLPLLLPLQLLLNYPQHPIPNTYFLEYDSGCPLVKNSQANTSVNPRGRRDFYGGKGNSGLILYSFSFGYPNCGVENRT